MTSCGPRPPALVPRGPLPDRRFAVLFGKMAYLIRRRGLKGVGDE